MKLGIQPSTVSSTLDANCDSLTTGLLQNLAKVDSDDQPAVLSISSRDTDGLLAADTAAALVL